MSQSERSEVEGVRKPSTRQLVNAGLLGVPGVGLLAFVGLDYSSADLVGQDGLILLGVVLSALGGWSWRLAVKRSHAVEFGPSNHAWMVSLLHRYVYLVHRCGLEPVLILDEIDKLAEPAYFQPQPEPKYSRVGGVLPPDLPIARFIDALVRVKQSLVTEFLWVMLDNGCVLQARQRELTRWRSSAADSTAAVCPMDRGPLSSLIHDVVELGPVPFGDLVSIARERWGVRADDYPRLALHWLRRGGNLGLIVRSEAGDIAPWFAEGKSREPASASDVVLWKAFLLAQAIEYVSDDGFAVAIEQLLGGGGGEEGMIKTLLEQPLVAGYVYRGMLEIALWWLLPQAVRPRLSPGYGANSDLEILMAEDVGRWREFGAALLVRHLRLVRGVGDVSYPRLDRTIESGQFGLPQPSSPGEEAVSKDLLLSSKLLSQLPSAEIHP